MQRGRNIMSLGGSKRGGIAKTKAGTASGTGTQLETMATLNINQTDQENKEMLSPTLSGQVDQMIAIRGRNSSLKMVGKCATMATSRNDSNMIGVRYLKMRGHKATLNHNFANKVDVGQSIQRFSIHLSPKN